MRGQLHYLIYLHFFHIPISINEYCQYVCILCTNWHYPVEANAKTWNQYYFFFVEKSVTLIFFTFTLKFTCTPKLNIFYLVYNTLLDGFKKYASKLVAKNENMNFLTFTLIFAHLKIFLCYIDLTLP